MLTVLMLKDASIYVGTSNSMYILFFILYMFLKNQYSVIDIGIKIFQLVLFCIFGGGGGINWND